MSEPQPAASEAKPKSYELFVDPHGLVKKQVGPKSVTEGQTLQFTVTGSDPDGNALIVGSSSSLTLFDLVRTRWTADFPLTKAASAHWLSARATVPTFSAWVTVAGRSSTISAQRRLS